MPLISVAELLSDPDFADEFTLIRRYTSTGTDGRAVHVEGRLDLMGVVQPAGPSAVTLLPEGARVSTAIVIFTAHKLLAAREDGAADEVLWNGGRYVVRSVADWGRWGAGHYEATCENIAFSAPNSP